MSSTLYPKMAFEPSPERLAAARAKRRQGRRFGWLLGDTIFDRIRPDFGLRFLHQVLGLDFLSYGLWDGDPLILAGLKTAQERYARLLCDWVPDDVTRILDVGCGTGGTALLLGERGFEVEGLSPDPFQQEVFPKRTGRPFHLMRFELFRPEHPFDLVMMSESAQYIMLDQLFRCVMRHSPGAYLLIADYFRVADGSGPAAKSGHPLDDFLDEARLWGFETVRQLDITEQVVPTLDLARLCVDRYIRPTIEIARQSAMAKSRLLARVGAWIVRRTCKSWNAQIQLIDREEFLRTKKYIVFLLKAPESMDELARARGALGGRTS
jgi:SAM-dependent methyltransferase